VTTYPVIAQRTLGPPAKSLWRLRRDLTELPTRLPGTELVARVDDKFEVLPGRLHDTDKVLLDALEILVIDTNPGRRIETKLELASQVPGESFRVRVTFSCTVTDPLEVAAAAPRDIVPVLRSHVEGDRTLMGAGEKFSIKDSGTKLRQYVTARITAWCLGRRPPARGMEIELASIEVDTPGTLRDHAEAMRRERDRQELEKLKDGFTFKQAALIERVINRGPEAIQALALRLNESRFQTASDAAYREREKRHQHLLSVMRILAEGKHFDEVAFDTPQLVDDLVNELLPGNSGANRTRDRSYVHDAVSQRPGIEGTRSKLPSGDGARTVEDADRPAEPPEEDELDG
jgi:hypothetical protein